eukprot:553345-Rhodomonas_salina.6
MPVYSAPSLGICYEMSGTETGSAGTRPTSTDQNELRASMSDTPDALQCVILKEGMMLLHSA